MSVLNIAATAILALPVAFPLAWLIARSVR